MKNRCLTVFTLAAGLFIMDASFCQAQESGDQKKTFEGTWNNRKYNSSGPLKCVAVPGEDGNVKATFSGKFMGDPFSYDVTFQAQPGDEQVDLSGKATISGHIYQWTGYLKGAKLFGQYRGTNGYNGTFSLSQGR